MDTSVITIIDCMLYLVDSMNVCSYFQNTFSVPTVLMIHGNAGNIGHRSVEKGKYLFAA